MTLQGAIEAKLNNALATNNGLTEKNQALSAACNKARVRLSGSS